MRTLIIGTEIILEQAETYDGYKITFCEHNEKCQVIEISIFALQALFTTLKREFGKEFGKE